MRRCALIQYEKIPWSGVPNCPAPANTPQRSTQTGKPKADPYSNASVSAASFVLPYNDIGGVVENSVLIPFAETPCGNGFEQSNTNDALRTSSGSVANKDMFSSLCGSQHFLSRVPGALSPILYYSGVLRSDHISAPIYESKSKRSKGCKADRPVRSSS